MIRYRAFRNSDPPLLAEVWRSRAGPRGIMQPMSAALLEQLVLSKPYFDRQGLIVALDDKRLVGFVHAGFGPTEDEQNISTELGVTCMLLVHPHEHEDEIAQGLLQHSEEYLRSRGATVLYAGCIHPLDPFYFGLYGGSELPGVLQSDVHAQRVYLAANYRPIDQTVIFQRDISTFRPVVDRQQMQIRRRTQLETVIDPPSKSWWDACTRGGLDRVRFDLVPRDTPPVASATVWNLEPLASSWGVRAGGLLDLEVDTTHRHEGLATFLLGEMFRQLQAEGISLVEAQTMVRNTAAVGLYKKLGFTEVDRGTVFRKG